MSSADKAQTNLTEDFILQCADFSITYEKGSRAMISGSKEKNGLDTLSLVFMYNDLDHYDNPAVFFDNIFNNRAVYDRLFPLKFSGRMDVSQFHNNFDIDKVAKDTEPFFIDILKSLHWYKRNYRKDLKLWLLGKKYPLTERHEKSFMKLTEFINLYSKDKEEYKSMVDSLFRCHQNYEFMVTGRKPTLETYTKVVKVDYPELKQDEELVIEEEHIKGEICNCKKCNCDREVDIKGETCVECVLGDHR
jgi:hypothetical protein